MNQKVTDLHDEFEIEHQVFLAHFQRLELSNAKLEKKIRDDLRQVRDSSVSAETSSGPYFIGAENSVTGNDEDGSLSHCKKLPSNVGGHVRNSLLFMSLAEAYISLSLGNLIPQYSTLKQFAAPRVPHSI